MIPPLRFRASLRRLPARLALGCWLACALPARAAEAPAPASAPGVVPLSAPGLANLFQLRTNLYSGAAPEGEEGFASLERLGVKTVISVDGAKPDVAAAHRHGMRYVHLPHGYDGIAPATQAELVNAVAAAPGGVFLHCHHGRHRGPAAAAVVCLAEGRWTPGQAESWLTRAGTATNYAGLFETVRRFRKPTTDELQAARAVFPESVEVSGLVDAMVAMDERLERLKAVQGAAFGIPAGSPDLRPASEARLLAEHLREAARLPESVRRGAGFARRLKESEEEALRLEQLLHREASSPSAPNRAALARSMDGLARGCADCHREHRDPPGVRSRRSADR
jgi:hypothetical protein